jgi:hypothetical protein
LILLFTEIERDHCKMYANFSKKANRVILIASLFGFLVFTFIYNEQLKKIQIKSSAKIFLNSKFDLKDDENVFFIDSGDSFDDVTLHPRYACAIEVIYFASIIHINSF